MSRAPLGTFHSPAAFSPLHTVAELNVVTYQSTALIQINGHFLIQTDPNDVCESDDFHDAVKSRKIVSIWILDICIQSNTNTEPT